MLIKRILSITLLMIAITSISAVDAVPVQIDAKMTFSDNTSIRAAKTELLSSARQNALEMAIPANLSVATLLTSMYSEQGYEIDERVAQSVFVNSTMAGFFTNEDFSFREPVFSQSSFELQIIYRAEIIPRYENLNQSNLFDLRLDECYIQSGSTVTVEIKPYTTGYFYIFNFMSDNSVILLYPNLTSADNKITTKESRILTFTAFKDKAYGSSVTVETIYAIYSQKEIFGWQKFKNNVNSQNIVFSAGEESFLLFQKWLSSADFSSIEEEITQIHIY